MEKQNENGNEIAGNYLAELGLKSYLTHGRENEAVFSYPCENERIVVDSIEPGMQLPQYITRELLSEQAEAYRSGVFYCLELFCRLFEKKYAASDYNAEKYRPFANYEVPVVLYGFCGFANMQAMMNVSI